MSGALAVRPTKPTVTRDGRCLYPCGCVDVPEERSVGPRRRPFLLCAGHALSSRRAS